MQNYEKSGTFNKIEKLFFQKLKSELNNNQ